MEITRSIILAATLWPAKASSDLRGPRVPGGQTVSFYLDTGFDPFFSVRGTRLQKSRTAPIEHGEWDDIVSDVWYFSTTLFSDYVAFKALIECKPNSLISYLDNININFQWNAIDELLTEIWPQSNTEMVGRKLGPEQLEVTFPHVIYHYVDGPQLSTDQSDDRLTEFVADAVQLTTGHLRQSTQPIFTQSSMFAGSVSLYREAVVAVGPELDSNVYADVPLLTDELLNRFLGIRLLDEHLHQINRLPIYRVSPSDYASSLDLSGARPRETIASYKTKFLGDREASLSALYGTKKVLREVRIKLKSDLISQLEKLDGVPLEVPMFSFARSFVDRLVAQSRGIGEKLDDTQAELAARVEMLADHVRDSVNAASTASSLGLQRSLHRLTWLLLVLTMVLTVLTIIAVYFGTPSSVRSGILEVIMPESAP